MLSSDVIEAFGGVVPLARHLGLGRTAVYRWIADGIPARRVRELHDLAVRLGLDRQRKIEGKTIPAITVDVLLHCTPSPSVQASKLPAPAAPSKARVVR